MLEIGMGIFRARLVARENPDAIAAGKKRLGSGTTQTLGASGDNDGTHGCS
jgi:hypothetical protein